MYQDMLGYIKILQDGYWIYYNMNLSFERLTTILYILFRKGHPNYFHIRILAHKIIFMPLPSCKFNTTCEDFQMRYCMTFFLSQEASKLLQLEDLDFPFYLIKTKLFGSFNLDFW